MTTASEPSSTPGRIIPLALVRRAFLEDTASTRMATLTGIDADGVSIRYLDGTTDTVAVTDPARLSEVTARDDLCRLEGEPLLLVSTRYGLLAVATGPASPPPRIAVSIVGRVEDGSVVELVGDRDQPAWQILTLAG